MLLWIKAIRKANAIHNLPIDNLTLQVKMVFLSETHGLMAVFDIWIYSLGIIPRKWTSFFNGEDGVGGVS